MTAERLATKRVEKVWGRRDLQPWFADVAPGGESVGEIWFEAAGDPDLLVKYLFTSERLSVQVHPDDRAAQAAGLPRGKDEAWVVIGAEPGATIGLGLVRPVSRDELRAAALDGSIEALLDWRPVNVGDVFYSPSGTVHAIGAGVTLVEVQQNSDTTYRLYDYGRPRELHLDAGIAVSNPVPFVRDAGGRALGGGRWVIAAGPAFTLERWLEGAEGALDVPSWVVPLAGDVGLDGVRAGAGETWLADAAQLTVGAGGDVLVARVGAGSAVVV